MEMTASAIGARSQMARTYLERHLSEFENSGKEGLIKHGLRALRESLSQDKELTMENTSVGIGGVGEDFKLVEGQDVQPWLESAFAEEGQVEAGEQQGQGERMDVDS